MHACIYTSIFMHAFIKDVHVYILYIYMYRYRYADTSVDISFMYAFTVIKIYVINGDKRILIVFMITNSIYYADKKYL